MSILWTLHLRREAASVPLARRLLLGAMETAGVDPDISYELGVALTEACANVVEHAGGNPADADDGYQVTAVIDGDRCLIEVRDSGPGFPDGRPRPALTDHLPPDVPFPDSPLAEPPLPSPPLPSPLLADLFFPDSWPGTERIGTGLVGTRTMERPPAPVGAESGRGMYLIEALADHVEFRNLPARGAVVSFDKALKWREGAGDLLRAS